VRNQSSWLDDRRIHGRDSLLVRSTPQPPLMIFDRVNF